MAPAASVRPAWAVRSAGSPPTGSGGGSCTTTSALAFALLPLILYPFTVIGAPAALGTVAWGWRKPGSIVRGRHLRFALAAILALAQIAAWTWLIIYLHRAALLRVHPRR